MRSILSYILLLVATSVVSTGIAQSEPDKESAQDADLKAFVETIKAEGLEPVEFILQSLDKHDLLIFDDALHNALDPFEFYMKLVRVPAFREKVKYVFLELAPVNRQPCLDAYFEAPVEDPDLLYPIFQDVADLGMAYKSYFDLLSTIYDVNEDLPENERLHVVAVSQPALWGEIKTHRDLEIYRQNYLYRDYLMYKFILQGLDGFASGRKGVFLTNTRHAYNGIRKSDGSLYWNTATFFRQWHPGKSMTIRFHSVSLYFDTSQESNSVTVRWVRMGGGIWDCAFSDTGDNPVALTLAGNPFGRQAYIGNHMLDVKAGQTMADAYDAVIFLAPLEKQRQSARVSDIYTSEFKREMARRLGIMYTAEQLEQELKREGARTVEEYIDLIASPAPEKPLSQAAEAGSRDSWRRQF
jgi:hypothetical protein